jgi:hypothetical protein
MTISGRGNCDNPGKKPESFVDSGRLIPIALPIRVARRESLCRFAAPGANRSVDARRPTPDARRPTRIALLARLFGDKLRSTFG